MGTSSRLIVFAEQNKMKYLNIINSKFIKYYKPIILVIGGFCIPASLRLTGIMCYSNKFEWFYWIDLTILILFIMFLFWILYLIRTKH